MSGKRGAFIVFEGLDRSGKTTQSALLLSRLVEAGKECVDAVWRFPDRTTKVGEMINQVISQSGDESECAPDPHVLHLLFTANRWEKSRQLQSLLTSGVTVVADRYSFSGVAYSVAAEGLPIEWCTQAEEGLVAPDLVIYLKLDAEAASERDGYGAEKYEKLTIQSKVGEVFETSLVTERTEGGSWVIVEAGKERSIQEISDEIFALVVPLVERAKNLPTKTLWEK